MHIHTMAGVVRTHLIGYVPGYGTVWFHPVRIANILSLSKVKDQYMVTYDSTKGNMFNVHKSNGQTRTFQESPQRLYFH